MSLFIFFIVSLATLALLHFAWIPTMERRIKLDRSMVLIGRSALLALLGALRGILLITTLTTAAILVVLSLLPLVGGANAEEAVNAIEAIRMWRGMLKDFGPIWGAVIVIVLVLAFSIQAYRRGKLRAQRAFQRLFDVESQRLEQMYDAGTLEPLPPTSEMESVQSKLNEGRRIITQLQEQDPTNSSIEGLGRQVYALGQYLKALDVQRRIDFKLDPEETELPNATTAWDRIQTLFISRGLLISLNRTSRVFFVASLISLVPSILGIYSGTVKAAVDDRIVRLTDFYIQEKQQELQVVKRELGEPANELDDNDSQLLDEVARAFENSMADIGVANISGRAMYTFRSTVVSDRILERAAQQRRSSIKKLPSGSQVQELISLEKNIIAVAEDASRTKGPTTKIGRYVSEELKDVAKRNPLFIDNLKASLHSFQRPASTRDISRALVNQITSFMVESAEPGNFGIVVDKTVSRMLEPESVRRLRSSQANNFLMKLIQGQGTNLGDALNTVSTGNELTELKTGMRRVLRDLPIDSINTKLSNIPPAVEAVPEPHVKLGRAVDGITRLRGISKSGSLEFADAVASYADWFPPQIGAEATTSRGELVKRWEPPTGSRPGNIFVPDQPTSASRAKLVRSRSFGRLRGFSRIGGVLIGREPVDASNSSNDFVDLRWETEGSNIRFVVVDRNGKEHRSQLHRMSVAYHALNYAADGRPIAVTMVTAPPMVELKVLLSPTLIDTPMGHRIIELDRFVDKYTVDDQLQQEAFARVKYEHDALYRLAWAHRRMVALDSISTDTSSSLEDLLQKRADLEELLEAIINDPVNRYFAEGALMEPEYLRSPDHSPLTVKTEFFDQTLVRLILDAANESKSIDQLEEAIRSGASLELAGATSLEKEVLLIRWQIPPPEFVVWSGVREQAHTVDLQDLIVPEESEMPMPFDFILQVAFTSPPAFAEVNRTVEEYYDEEPWEFPSLEEHIQTIVRSSVLEDERDHGILNDTAEFTVLQRFFRVALSGYLGYEFPVEKLISLSEDLEPSVPKVEYRTLRWNARPGLDDELRSIINDENQEEIQLKLDVREALGIPRDEEQVLEEIDAPVPSLDVSAGEIAKVNGG